MDLVLVGLHKAEQFRPDLCSSIELPVAIVEDFIPDGVFRINGFTRGIPGEFGQAEGYDRLFGNGRSRMALNAQQAIYDNRDEFTRRVKKNCW
jgi:hypothetical protein